MKPNFALTLSFEGIGLLHRAFPGWHMVGEVGLDNPDLAAALADLRARAAMLDPSGLRSKLVIPNDQIRYLQFDAIGLEADEIGDAARRVLDGSTPYNVDDLAYDWSISAGQVHIAAVARETLAEAEAFAAEHQFNPLCFVAVPEAREFVGEPWFGETQAAADMLPEGGHVERDTAAIRVIGAAPSPAEKSADAIPTAVDQDGTGPEAEPELPVLNEGPDEPQDIADAPAPDIAADAPLDAPEPEAAPEPEPKPEVEIESGSVFETRRAKAPQVDDQSSATNPDLPETDASQPEAPAPVSFSSIRARRDDLPASTPRLEGATRQAPDTKSNEETPNEPSDTPSGRKEPPLTTSAPEPAKGAPAVTGAPEDALSVDAAARIGASLRPTEEDKLSPDPVTEPDPDDKPRPSVLHDLPPEPAISEPAIEAAPVPEPQPVFEPEPEAEPDPQPAPQPDGARAPSFFTRRQAILKRGRPKDRAKPDPAASREQEKQRMTVFGAREPVRIGGKPKFLGVILTAVLLIFLVGVAAWASIFLDDGLANVLRDNKSETQQIAATPDADIDLADNEPDIPSEDETVLASLPNVTTDGEETPRAALPDPDPAELSPDEARARYAVTGIWLRAPQAPRSPEILSLDDFYQTSIDPKVLEQDAVALPDTLALLNDARPITPPDPPAASTTYRLDPRGLVTATPEGALTPDGVEVFAGKPRLVPPNRPAEPEVAQPDAEDIATDPELARLAAFRPKSRPSDLSEQNERSNLGGRTLDELAALRPKLRPPSAQELAQQAAAASTAAAAAAVPTDPDAVENAIAAAVQTPDPLAGATAQAVARSVKPKNRPRNFDRIVKRSQRETVQTAAVVPRSQRVSPSAPTATTVARAATEKNALRLKRVNLIGVYGSPSNRRALVRLANGRYKKVKIGDRLDGGRVAAIGDSELRYVKSGRSVTLKMPRG